MLCPQCKENEVPDGRSYCTRACARAARKKKANGRREARNKIDLAGKICERCGSKQKLVRHHKDRNPRNNRRSNLEILCGDCHKEEHEKPLPAEGLG